MAIDLEQLVRLYQQRLLAIRRQTALAAATAFVALANVDDPAPFVAAATASTLAGQTAVADLVAGYLALILEDLGDPAITPPATTAVTGAAVRNGTATDAVYERAVIQVRRALADGRTWEQGMAEGRARAISTAETDVMLTQRAAMADMAQRTPRIVGYRRVLTGRSCVLCGVASTQRYRTDQLMPIHNHCDCGVAPIIGDQDPGNVLNRQAVRQLKADTGRADYWNARGVVDDQGRLVAKPNADVVAVHMHGELGPVLTDRSQNFTGPGDIAG
jgi:hypothetical protein